ncbi:rifin PIR protein, putative [Plasmodium reichenowi]|uniref:Rifin PIR protein, putative n=1 Tax=Plasmodium reichenowi TaxID=5854 RepID=A0A2P9DT06_PLARE|nr:rifin PIR protein, putative [Plasmodium reichenowi]
MNVYYINILLFALPLNILVYNQRNHNITPCHTPKIPTTRLLCECELYSPANYDNDPQMKEVMDNFNKQTQQRFHEYDERMKTTRHKCKDQCNKEIQKIILKDILEKQMAQQLTTLETKIDTNDIPTCICEKSLADKVEKNCMKCGGVLGSGVAPSIGLFGGLAVNQLTKAAMLAAAQKGIEEGVKYGIQELSDFFGLSGLIKVSKIKNLINPTNYANETTYVTFIQKMKNSMCYQTSYVNKPFCNAANERTVMFLQRASKIAEDAKYSAEVAEKQVLNAATPALTTYSNAIIASIVAILVIVLVMVIIYLILRYRRKKKMKKKLQYIKLLKE